MLYFPDPQNQPLDDTLSTSPCPAAEKEDMLCTAQLDERYNSVRVCANEQRRKGVLW